jgi:hypothetical protein
MPIGIIMVTLLVGLGGGSLFKSYSILAGDETLETIVTSLIRLNLGDVMCHNLLSAFAI